MTSSTRSAHAPLFMPEAGLSFESQPTPSGADGTTDPLGQNAASTGDASDGKLQSRVGEFCYLMVASKIAFGS